MGALTLPFLPCDSLAQAATKFALVLGNGQYQGKDRRLSNAEADARLVAKSLTALGFDVTVAFNLARRDMHQAVSGFAERLPQGALAFVFYAGHGMQLGGLNYLIPVDMQPNSEQAVQVSALPLRILMEQLAASKAAVNVVALDACRNNPFQQEILVRMRSIIPRNGLAAVKAPRGTLVAYSTAPGQLAADGKGGNSLYADSLARMLREPGLSLEQIFKRVGQQVRESTGDSQIPWFESSLSDDVYL
jgi:uncharacterized caspase-like protein